MNAGNTSAVDDAPKDVLETQPKKPETLGPKPRLKVALIEVKLSSEGSGTLDGHFSSLLQKDWAWALEPVESCFCTTCAAASNSASGNPFSTNIITFDCILLKHPK